MNDNPYQTPSSLMTLAAVEKHKAPCPVCGYPLSRVRLTFPFARCSNCRRRMCLRRSWKSSTLSTLTAIVFFVSMSYFEAVPGSNGLLFAIHAVTFLALGTTWFHLFAQPSLAGRLGPASPVELVREKRRFLEESVSDTSLTDNPENQTPEHS